MSMHNPAHPGEILRELIIEPLELTVTDVAEHLNVSRKTLSKVINGRGAITPEMSVRKEGTILVGQIGRSLMRPAVDDELLFQEQVFCDHCTASTRS